MLPCFAWSIRLATVDPVVTGSTKMTCCALMVIVSARCHSLPRCTRVLLACFQVSEKDRSGIEENSLVAGFHLTRRDRTIAAGFHRERNQRGHENLKISFQRFFDNQCLSDSGRYLPASAGGNPNGGYGRCPRRDLRPKDGAGCRYERSWRHRTNGSGTAISRGLRAVAISLSTNLDSNIHLGAVPDKMRLQQIEALILLSFKTAGAAPPLTPLRYHFPE